MLAAMKPVKALLKKIPDFIYKTKATTVFT